MFPVHKYIDTVIVRAAASVCAAAEIHIYKFAFVLVIQFLAFAHLSSVATGFDNCLLTTTLPLLATLHCNFLPPTDEWL